MAMKKLTFITNKLGLRAVIIHEKISPGSVKKLHAMCPENFRLSLKLSQRWDAWGVLATRDYEKWCFEGTPFQIQGLELFIQS